jgi:hypothetical protein
MKYERLWEEVESRKDVTLYIPRYPDEIVIPQLGYLVTVLGVGAVLQDVASQILEDNFDYQVGNALHLASGGDVGYYLRVYQPDSSTVYIDIANLFLDIKQAMRYAAIKRKPSVLDLSTGKTIIRKDKRNDRSGTHRQVARVRPKPEGVRRSRRRR